jgi:hypothetical protein
VTTLLVPGPSGRPYCRAGSADDGRHPIRPPVRVRIERRGRRRSRPLSARAGEPLASRMTAATERSHALLRRRLHFPIVLPRSSLARTAPPRAEQQRGRRDRNRGEAAASDHQHAEWPDPHMLRRVHHRAGCAYGATKIDRRSPSSAALATRCSSAITRSLSRTSKIKALSRAEEERLRARQIALAGRRNRLQVA